MQPKRDWQSLDQKLRDGKPFSVAASEAGIPLEEAQEYADKRLQNRAGLSYKLVSAAEGALQTAMEKLTAIANEPPRDRIERLKKAADAVGMPEHMKVTLYNTDLDAAKALATIAINVLKLGGGAATKEGGKRGEGGAAQADLWDNPGNWNLSKPGV